MRKKDQHCRCVALVLVFQLFTSRRMCCCRRSQKVLRGLENATTRDATSAFLLWHSAAWPEDAKRRLFPGDWEAQWTERGEQVKQALLRLAQHGDPAAVQGDELSRHPRYEMQLPTRDGSPRGKPSKRDDGKIATSDALPES